MQSQLKLFFALSRTPHALIDMAAPFFAALLSLGHLPGWPVGLVGALAVFGGYTCIYALNDLVGYESDRAKIQAGFVPRVSPSHDLDALMVRHPIAQGLLPYRYALIWVGGWGLVAVVSAAWLNPVCLAIFFAGCLLEAVYCLLWRISPYRTVVNGVVKTLGAIAAVYAVQPSPNLFLVGALFLMFFLWEIGGQNIPNDWSDVKEDRHFAARTVPVYFGLEIAAALIYISLIFTAGAGVLLLRLSPSHGGLWEVIGFLGICTCFLYLPAGRLYQAPGTENAMALFNRASYFPLALFILSILGLAV